MRSTIATDTLFSLQITFCVKKVSENIWQALKESIMMRRMN